MEQTREKLYKHINYLYKELVKATYGEDKTNGHYIGPSTDRFYIITCQLYDAIDEIFENFCPPHLSINDWRLINGHKRNIILDIDVLKDNKKIQGDKLTWTLEKILSKVKGDVKCIMQF